MPPAPPLFTSMTQTIAALSPSRNTELSSSASAQGSRERLLGTANQGAILSAAPPSRDTELSSSASAQGSHERLREAANQRAVLSATEGASLLLPGKADRLEEASTPELRLDGMDLSWLLAPSKTTAVLPADSAAASERPWSREENALPPNALRVADSDGVARGGETAAGMTSVNDAGHPGLSWLVALVGLAYAYRLIGRPVEEPRGRALASR
jgi:hypothetical protein